MDGVTPPMQPSNSPPGQGRRAAPDRFLASAVFGHGGIQRHNRSFCIALASWCARRGYALEIISFQDPDRRILSDQLGVPVTGCGGRRGRFIFRILATLRRPHDLLIAGHVDLMPVVAALALVCPGTRTWLLAYGIEVWGRLPWYKRWSLRTAGRIWSISTFTGRALVAKQRADASRIEIVPASSIPNGSPGRRHGKRRAIGQAPRRCSVSRG